MNLNFTALEHGHFAFVIVVHSRLHALTPQNKLLKRALHNPNL